MTEGSALCSRFQFSLLLLFWFCCCFCCCCCVVVVVLLFMSLHNNTHGLRKKKHWEKKQKANTTWWRYTTMSKKGMFQLAVITGQVSYSKRSSASIAKSLAGGWDTLGTQFWWRTRERKAGHLPYFVLLMKWNEIHCIWLFLLFPHIMMLFLCETSLFAKK